MSKFFAAGSSSDDSDESEDESLDSGSDDGAEKVQQSAPLGRAAFLKSDSEDSEDEGPRVVKSARDKRWEAMIATIKSMRNHLKINDWNAIVNDFDALTKQLQKASAIVAKEGVPKFYYKTLLMLEANTNKTLEDKEAKKKMSPTNAKSLNSMRQKVRKHNKELEEPLAAIREAGFNPLKDDPLEEDDEDDDAWLDESDESDEDESDESDAEEADAAASKAAAEARAKAKADKALSRAKGKEEAAAAKAGAPALSKQEEQEKVEAEVDRRLEELLALRGRKGTDRTAQVSQLHELRAMTQREEKQLALTLHLITAYFDMNANMLTLMSHANWTHCFNALEGAIAQVAADPSLERRAVIGEAIERPAAEADGEGEEAEAAAEAAAVADAAASAALRLSNVCANLLAFMERLDDEYYKALQLQPFTEGHGAETADKGSYLARLRDEPRLVRLMSSLLDHFKGGKGGTAAPVNLPAAARVAARMIERIYYKPQATYDAQWAEIRRRRAVASAELERATKAGDEAAVAAASATLACLSDPEVEDIGQTMASLSALAYAYADERSKTRALLCHAFHHARHERFHTARDMLLMSHLQDTIGFSDISTQILYNRALVRVGVAAFHHGYYADCVAALGEMVGANRQRELLAQGLSSARFNERNPETEKLERRRQVPFHMHLSLELVEACFLVSTLLLEMPLLVAQRNDPKRRLTQMSKALRRLIDSYDRLVFAAPAEHLREHMVACGQQLLEGDWQRACSTLVSLPAWDMMTDPQRTRDMLKARVQEEGLRSFLLSFASAYQSISLQQLAARFELPVPKVHALVSKMLAAEQVDAAWDGPSASLLLSRGAQLSRLQTLSLTLADKANALVESNERLLDARTGGYGYKVATSWSTDRVHVRPSLCRGMSAAKLLARKRSRAAEAQKAEPPAPVLRKVPASRRSKVLALISHGSTTKFTALMEDWVALLPHMRKDCKLEQKDRVDTIAEIAELAGCNRALFFEVRKHSDLYLWAGSVPSGPTVKFHVQAVHSMDELSLTGNCLRGSRGIVSFDSAFSDGAAPHLLMVRQVLIDTFAVPEGHPKSKPFIDHVHSFALDRLGKVHYRHYQIVNSADGADGGRRSQAGQMLVEVGPRCTLTVMRIFAGAFGGPTLYANSAFVSPNHVRAEVRRKTGERYAKRVTARAAMRKRHASADRQMPRDELGDVFRDAVQ